MHHIDESLKSFFQSSLPFTSISKFMISEFKGVTDIGAMKNWRYRRHSDKRFERTDHGLTKNFSY